MPILALVPSCTMKDFFPDRIEFLQFPFHIASNSWPNDPETSILVRRRGSDSDGSACVDGARVVQETKPVTCRDLDISRGQQIALDNFVEAPSGHVNVFGCAKSGQTESRKLYPTFAAVAQLFRLSMLGTFKREEKSN